MSLTAPSAIEWMLIQTVNNNKKIIECTLGVMNHGDDYWHRSCTGRGGGIKNKEQFRIDKSRRDGSGGGREIGYGDLLRIFTVRIDLELTAFKCAPSDPSGEFPPGSNCCFSFKLIAVKL